MFIAGASVAFAQLPAAASAFEVASVRTVDPDRSMSIIRSGNSLTFSNYSLEMPILWEWNIRSDRLLGKPKGLDSVRYDIVTAASEGPSSPDSESYDAVAAGRAIQGTTWIQAGCPEGPGWSCSDRPLR